MVSVETSFAQSLKADIYFEALRSFPYQNYGHTNRDFVEIRQKMITYAARKLYDSGVNWHRVYQIVTKRDYVEPEEEKVAARVSTKILKV